MAYEILRHIRYNEATKWDLIKIVGNNRQFDHWVTGFLVEDGFVIAPSKVTDYFRLSNEG